MEEAPPLTAGGLDVVEPEACEEPRFPGEEQLFEELDTSKNALKCLYIGFKLA